MKFFLSILLAIAATLAGNAQCKLSPYSLNYLQQYKAGNVSTESGVKSKSRLKAEIVDNAFPVDRLFYARFCRSRRHH